MAEQRKVGPLCTRVNVPTARFCAGCGSSLQLAPLDLEPEHESNASTTRLVPQPSASRKKGDLFFSVAVGGVFVVIAAVIISFLVQRPLEDRPVTDEDSSVTSAGGAIAAGVRMVSKGENRPSTATEFAPDLGTIEELLAAGWVPTMHTVFRSTEGRFLLWLVTEAGNVFVVRSGIENVRPLVEVNDIEIGPLDDEGIPTSIAGYERLQRGQTLRYLQELNSEFDGSSSVLVRNLDETWINVMAESDN